MIIQGIRDEKDLVRKSEERDLLVKKDRNNARSDDCFLVICITVSWVFKGARNAGEAGHNSSTARQKIVQINLSAFNFFILILSFFDKLECQGLNIQWIPA